jgi:uncharacterized protein YndB with AHSA1/START domain
MKDGAPLTDRHIFQKVVEINASRARVWQALTTPVLMKQWMMPDAELQILTDWSVGSPLIIRGKMNGKEFENTGAVLQFEPERVLRYSHLSSISRLPDRPESYTRIEFRLLPIEERTRLTLTISNFPTESIYHHLVFYWKSTIEVF